MSTLKVNNILTTSGTANRGKVIQVVTGYNSGKYRTSSSSYVSLVTSPSITPTASTSSILIMISTMTYRETSNGNSYFAVYRNGVTSLLQSGQSVHFSHWNDYSTYAQNNTGWMYIDSPATSSATNYQIMGYTTETTGYAGIGGRGNDTSHNCGVLWTLMELSA